MIRFQLLDRHSALEGVDPLALGVGDEGVVKLLQSAHGLLAKGQVGLQLVSHGGVLVHGSLVEDLSDLVLGVVADQVLHEQLGQLVVLAVLDNLNGSRSGEVIQKINYYPFGAQLCDGVAVSNVQSRKYNGKEYDNMHGLNTYDYGARQYNPVTVRWDRMDTMCEKYYDVSPYAYCAGDPVNAIDLDGKDYWTTNNPDQIFQFLKAIGLGNTQFDFSEWNHATDADFCGNLVYNDESHKFYTSYAEVTNGELVVTAKSFDANIIPVSSTGLGYPGAFIYEPINGFWENANYYLNGLTYNDGFTNWNVNRNGRITGETPILGIADFGGKSKASYIKSILPKGFKLSREYISHNERVYEYNGKYYSFDNTSHNGGIWKVFVKKGGRLQRIRTADKNLNIFKK